jgi:hypothetical protein
MVEASADRVLATEEGLVLQGSSGNAERWACVLLLVLVIEVPRSSVGSGKVDFLEMIVCTHNASSVKKKTNRKSGER